jgi:hypothetical protein
MSQFLVHQSGIAGGGEQMIEASQEFVSGGDTGGQAGADARAQWDEFLAPQLIEQCRWRSEPA